MGKRLIIKLIEKKHQPKIQLVTATEQGEIVPSPLNGDVSSLLVHSVVAYKDMSDDELYHANKKKIEKALETNSPPLSD